MCEVWWVAAHGDERPFTIAATDPICPRCGTTLLTLLELEGSPDRQLGAEVGPVFDQPSLSDTEINHETQWIDCAENSSLATTGNHRR